METSNKRLVAFNAKANEKKYWSGKLAGHKELFFASCHADELSAESSISTREFKLDADLHAKLARICPDPGALLVMLTAVLCVQVNKFLDETQVVLATPIESPLTKVLPLVIDVNTDHTFRELLQTAKQVYLEARANQDYPVDLLVKGRQLANLGITVGKQFHENTPEIVFNYNGDNCSVSYDTKVYHEQDVALIFDSYQLLLRNCLQHPDRKISGMEALSAGDKHKILNVFNATQADYPSTSSIVAVFEQQVKNTPGNIAVTYNDEHITYGELNQRADALAGRLLHSGVKPQTNIAVFQRVDIDYIVAILAILKVRCAYVPLSLNDPLARIAGLLDDMAAEFILTTKDAIGTEQQTFGERKLIFADDRTGHEFKPADKPLHSDTAYVMFTSGSTGTPKGVMVTHRNVLRLVCNPNYVKLSAETRILLTGSANFDATTFEIWGSLLNGGVLSLVDKQVLLDTDNLHAALTNNKINTLWLTSAFFNQVVQQSKHNIFSGLSYLLVGGDVLSAKHINIVRENNPGLQIINGYGPTENTTFSLTMPITKEYSRSIPIGRPISNSTAYVLGSNLQLKPVGAWGILYVGGHGVASGYLNAPILTHEKFIQNPFGQGCLYRTDDVARMLPDLTIEFKGRIDDQVKIRGFRVTLGEIEHQLSRHELISEAVVLVKEENGDKHLIAYYVSPAEVNTASLKQFLSASLPDYMVPAYFVHLTSMPLTANGKINRKLLPAITPATAFAYEAPANQTEEQLAEIWGQLFQMDSSQVSVTANFFDLGGHSLKATALMNQINRIFETHIIIKDVFTAPTIREQAALIKMKQWAVLNNDYDTVEGMEIVV
jgi:amino acid adenylation domain-containing protein